MPRPYHRGSLFWAVKSVSVLCTEGNEKIVKHLKQSVSMILPPPPQQIILQHCIGIYEDYVSEARGPVRRILS